MKIPNQHQTVEVLPCPVCKLTISARVEMELTPTIGKTLTDQKISADLAVRMVRFNVTHACPGPLTADAEASR